jgi:hypothetical protein
VKRHFEEETMRARSSDETLRELQLRGARRLKSVRFRANRSIVWSLTQDATVLNLHVAYRRAPACVLDALAVIVRGRGWKTTAVREASERVLDWPGLSPVLEAVRASHAQRQRRAATGCAGGGDVTHCCGTPEQRRYLRAVYRYLNRTRFDGLLPDDIPIRLSNRMRVGLGHMLPGRDQKGGHVVMELALNVDLLLEGNGAERMDTLLHEMAHVAEWVLEGSYGHGATWKRWARHAGCRAESCYDRPVVRRRRRHERVTRVPPLPPALRRRVA